MAGFLFGIQAAVATLNAVPLLDHRVRYNFIPRGSKMRRAGSSPMTTSSSFRPRSRQERLEWVAARFKERLSPLPHYAKYTDLDWLRMAPPSSVLMQMPVLDPNCKVTTPPEWYGYR